MFDQMRAKECSDAELEQTVGGAQQVSNGIFVGRIYYIHVQTGYVALRNYPAYNSSNEIGPLWTGTEVTVTDYTSGGYAYVAVNQAAKGPWGDDMSGKSGYVNINYLES